MESQEEVVKEDAATSFTKAHKAQCFKCRENVEVVDPQEQTMKNDRRRVFGKCAKCGGQLEWEFCMPNYRTGFNFRFFSHSG